MKAIRITRGGDVLDDEGTALGTVKKDRHVRPCGWNGTYQTYSFIPNAAGKATGLQFVSSKLRVVRRSISHQLDSARSALAKAEGA